MVGGWVGGLEIGCAARGGEGGEVGPSGFMRGAYVVSGMNHSVWPRAAVRGEGGVPQAVVICLNPAAKHR